MLKIIKQHDERDCGAACIAMAAAHFGLKLSIAKCRKLTKTDRNGANLYGLADAAENVGLDAETLFGGIDELISGISSDETAFPFIAHVLTEDNMQHFVIVFGIKNGKFIIGDPAKGKVKHSFEHFAKMWSGYIMTLSPKPTFKKGRLNGGGSKKFFALLRGQYRHMIGIIALSLIVSAIGIIGAFVFESVTNNFYEAHSAVTSETPRAEEHKNLHASNTVNILDRAVVLITGSTDDFNAFFIFIIGLYILQAAIRLVRGYLMALLAKNMDIRLMLSYYDHIIGLPMSDITTRNTGEYLSRFSDASTIRNAVSGATLTLLMDSLMAVACGVILFMNNRRLFVVALIMVVLYAVVVLIYRRPIEHIDRDIMENNARVESYMKESIDGIATIKASNSEKLVIQKNSSKFNRLLRSVFKGNMIFTSQDSICDMIELIGTAIILWIGFGTVVSGLTSIGSLMSFYALLAYFSNPIKNVINLQPMVQTAIVAADRLNDILEIETEAFDEITDFHQKWNELKIENIDFRYGNRELTLKNLSLKIKKGEKIAIIGESGSGKTTLAKLLMRFYTPESGDIFFDDTSIKDMNVSDIRQRIAYVDQNTFLFSDTVKNNLLIGSPNATDEEINTACEKANAKEFIEKLPFGLDTFLDENGQSLSGGQRQRLAIARALLKKPQILILDEATSNLDTITEAGIKNTLLDIDSSITYIVIAHRLSTIKGCDRIIVMDDSEIIEQGTHDELMAKKGKYHSFYQRQ